MCPPEIHRSGPSILRSPPSSAPQVDDKDASRFGGCRISRREGSGLPEIRKASGLTQHRCEHVKLQLSPPLGATSECRRQAGVLSAADTLAEIFPGVDALDYTNAVPPPPAPSSIAAEADLAAVLQAQAWRTPDQIAWAERVAKADYFVLMSEGILPKDSRRRIARTHAPVAANLRHVGATQRGAA